MSASETALVALLGALQDGAPPDAEVARNLVVPARIPRGGLLILRDGDPGEPEVVLSPRHYFYEHQAQVDVVVEAAPDERDAIFDLLRSSIGTAVALDRTLGGAVDWAECEAGRAEVVVVDGSEEIKAATITVVLHYGSADPLS